MKQKLLLVMAVAFFFAACSNEKKDKAANDEKTSDTKTTENWNMPDSATMMKNWQEYMTPGDMHKMMASWEGTWQGDITMWDNPDAPPNKSITTAIYKSTLGGLYLESVHTGDMMGMPFEGHSILAYDNASKKFMSTWIDNMGTGVMMLTGPYDAATKTMTLTGKAYNPMMGKEGEYRETFKIIDDNNSVMEMYGPGMDGKETKMMEIKSTRKS